jgi:hypothetical protein
MRPPATLSALSLVLLLAGCDLFGGESAEAAAARREAEGKAVGSACRHAMRAIEDCYTLNPKTMKSAVFAGWREMDEYMRENKIDGIAPTIERPVEKAEGGKSDADPKTKYATKSTAKTATRTARADKAEKADGSDKSEKPAEPAPTKTH